jgi:serine protease Do
VTAGILSARSRDIGEGPYDDFLQVDAAINSGNSGGPLFDSQGRVVGINTAIYSPSGGNVGIGFAIPQRMAQKVAQQIITSGSVSRGRIGVSLQPITPQMAASLGLQGTSGALIADVDAEGAGAASGLERGDVVRSFGGVQVKDGHALARMVADAKAGSNVAVSVLRNGQQVAINLRIGGDPNA